MISAAGSLAHAAADRYARHVAIPWSSLLPAFPHILSPRSTVQVAQPTAEPEPEAAGQQPTLAPCMAMRKMMQNYVRHAQNDLEVRHTERIDRA